MSNTAAHLIDRVIAPDVTLRQWVLSVPFELRLLLAAKADALSAVGRIFMQELQRWQRQQARALGVEHAQGAGVSFCQRFGASLNLNVHWHVIVPDALFLPDASGERVTTQPLRAPTRLDLDEIVTAVAARCIRWLEQHGHLRSEGEEDSAAAADADSPWMKCLQGSLGVGELQRRTERDHAEQRRGTAPGRLLPKPSKGLVAEYLKFNLHAGVSVPSGLPAARERLLRYCARPPLALERLSVLDDGRICYRIKDSDQVRLMTPTQFLARLAALVPPPRHPLVRFYGVWAPHSRWRSLVMPAAPAPQRTTCAAAAGAFGRSAAVAWALTFPRTQGSGLDGCALDSLSVALGGAEHFVGRGLCKFFASADGTQLFEIPRLSGHAGSVPSEHASPVRTRKRAGAGKMRPLAGRPLTANGLRFARGARFSAERVGALAPAAATRLPSNAKRHRPSTSRIPSRSHFALGSVSHPETGSFRLLRLRPPRPRRRRPPSPNRPWPANTARAVM